MRRAHPDDLAALSDNARDSRTLERDYALDAIRRGQPVYYCRGAGFPVVVLRTLDDWERRDSLHRAVN